MTNEVRQQLIDWAVTYNDPVYFETDPISFPRHFARRSDCCLKDVEVAAVFASHFAWGRRAMIVRDCKRLFDQMGGRPYDYVMRGNWKDDPISIHRTVKWSDTAAICSRLKEYYSGADSLESLSTSQIREKVYGQKADPRAPNKKINMMRRWMVRCDGKVDLGLWTNSSPKDLIIPLDVHVYTQAVVLGLTCRKQKDLKTAEEITDCFRSIFPDDPTLGDFALFGYGIDHA